MSDARNDMAHLAEHALRKAKIALNETAALKENIANLQERLSEQSGSWSAMQEKARRYDEVFGGQPGLSDFVEMMGPAMGDGNDAAPVESIDEMAQFLNAIVKHVEKALYDGDLLRSRMLLARVAAVAFQWHGHIEKMTDLTEAVTRRVRERDRKDADDEIPF